MRVTMRPSLKLLLLLLSGLGLSAHGGEIINGEKVREGEMPYMVSVQNDDGHHICGGFLISEDFVLTAAHCDNNSMAESVVLGAHDLKNEKAMRYSFKAKCKHESYNNETLLNDIMLLKLNETVRLKKRRVEIIKLPKPKKKVMENETCQVAGWGLTNESIYSVTELRKVDVCVRDLTNCKKDWAKKNEHLPDNVMCAGGYTKDGKGACQGDSGGPLVCKNTAVGIVSFNRNESCNYPDVPNVYTNLSQFIGWIKKTIKKKC